MSAILRLQEVIRLTGLSRSSIHRLEASGLFPKRRLIGRRAVGWVSDDVHAFIQSRAEVTVNCKAARSAP